MKTVEKPWGREEWLFVSDRLCMKKLYVNKGQRLSLQKHPKKEEGSFIVYGKLNLEIDNEEREVNAGDWWHCEPNTIHRITAIEDSLIVEASTPEVDDVVRLEDDYGRE